MNVKSILLAVDKESSGGAVPIAAGLARRFDARITLVHLGRRITPGRVSVAGAVRSLERSGANFEVRLERTTSRATIAQSLLTMAEDLRADLIVLGSRGRPAPIASLFGSVSREVARGAHVPVLIVRDAARQAGPPARLLLVITEETLGSVELDVGIELARGLGAKVTVLHVHGGVEEAVEDILKVPASRRPDHVAKLLLAKLGTAGVEANLVITSNRDGLAAEISRAALGAGSDLIVIPAGTSDAAERWLLGTVEEEISRRSRTPVVVAPPNRVARGRR